VEEEEEEEEDERKTKGLFRQRKTEFVSSSISWTIFSMASLSDSTQIYFGVDKEETLPLPLFHSSFPRCLRPFVPLSLGSSIPLSTHHCTLLLFVGRRLLLLLLLTTSCLVAPSLRRSTNSIVSLLNPISPAAVSPSVWLSEHLPVYLSVSLCATHLHSLANICDLSTFPSTETHAQTDELCFNATLLDLL